MKLNEKVAAGIAEEYLDWWRRVARYDELAVMEENGDKDWENVTGEDGQEYKVLSYVLPHGDEMLRIWACCTRPVSGSRNRRVRAG